MTGEMSLEKIVPLRHAVDLMLIVALTGALGQVTLSPLAVASGELANAFNRILTIVTINIISIASFALGATVGQLLLIVETASLIATLKVGRHTLAIGGELGDPGVFGRQELEPGIQHLLGELIETIETLEWMPWWNLLVIGCGSNGKEKGW